MTVDLGIEGLTDAALIGRGGFGNVYRARFTRLNRVVAVKGPLGRGGDRRAPANTPGIRHVAFAVDDIDAVVASPKLRLL